MTSAPTELQVDAFLCDAVVAADGKLYAHGVGWTNLSAQGFPLRHSRLGVGVTVWIPYTATNEQHQFELRIERDGKPMRLGDKPDDPEDERGVTSLGGRFAVGRPPLLPAGDMQVSAFAIQLDGLIFPDPDLYSVVIEIDGQEMRRLPFRVLLLGQGTNPLIPK